MTTDSLLYYGAYYLRAHHQERLASLVAHHSEAQYEAALLGLADGTWRYREPRMRAGWSMRLSAR